MGVPKALHTLHTFAGSSTWNKAILRQICCERTQLQIQLQNSADMFCIKLHHEALKSLQKRYCNGYMGVSKNWGTPKSSILIGFSIINHPFWGINPIFGSTPIYLFHNSSSRLSSSTCDLNSCHGLQAAVPLKCPAAPCFRQRSRKSCSLGRLKNP